MGGINIFILLSTTAFVYCAPLAYFMESHKWSASLDAARASVGSQHLYFLMALSAVLYTVIVSLHAHACRACPKSCSAVFASPCLPWAQSSHGTTRCLHTLKDAQRSQVRFYLAGVQRVFVSRARPGLLTGHAVCRWAMLYHVLVSELLRFAVMHVTGTDIALMAAQATQ